MSHVMTRRRPTHTLSLSLARSLSLSLFALLCSASLLCAALHRSLLCSVRARSKLQRGQVNQPIRCRSGTMGTDTVCGYTLLWGSPEHTTPLRENRKQSAFVVAVAHTAFLFVCALQL